MSELIKVLWQLRVLIGLDKWLFYTLIWPRYPSPMPPPLENIMRACTTVTGHRRTVSSVQYYVMRDDGFIEHGYLGSNTLTFKIGDFYMRQDITSGRYLCMVCNEDSGVMGIRSHNYAVCVRCKIKVDNFPGFWE